jgi:hypothetical protein
MKELFEKVYIRSETDLPQARGWYFICHRVFGNDITDRDMTRADTDCWMEDVRWYLRPMDSVAEMPTEEEMIAFANFFHKHKKAIERGECPKRPDELLKEFRNRMSKPKTGGEKK